MQCIRMVMCVFVLGSCAAPSAPIGGIVAMAPITSAGDHLGTNVPQHLPCPSEGACRLQASLVRLEQAAGR
ncbi:Hypothetical protein GbCGDNIH4_7283 [Granulibacter bethesdensis CGDNIH4]|nr:Hypothetical protein GbCGDNIH4_7283 [Granulibacter bethesdensis CGDNIH4]